MPTPDEIPLDEVARYYSDRVRQHGATPAGADWNSAASQHLRFEQLAALWAREFGPIEILDVGCGYGALVGFLEASGRRFHYVGYDIAEEMLRAAAPLRSAHVSFTRDPAQVPVTDYVVASGVFNVKLRSDPQAWSAYVRETVNWMADRARKGFAFNALTAYSDPARQRSDLWYASATEWFDYCVRRHSRFVTLVHDYPLYEFTILVRKEERKP